MDLKSDLDGGVLRVQASHGEPDALGDVAPQLAAELRIVAGWLGLEGLAVEPSGDLAAAFQRAVIALPTSNEA